MAQDAPAEGLDNPLGKLKTVVMFAAEQPNLDTVAYRGRAPLAHLALISQADTFDQVTRPGGLQRDLSPKHAAEAYEYLRRKKDRKFPRAFPEVVLNVRDKKALKLRKLADPPDGFDGVPYELTVDVDYIRRHEGETAISRVDGNHRLYYAGGDARRDPIMLPAPFQIHVGLSPEQETSLFIDINANQKGLNSSHLAVLRGRLTPDEIELKMFPSRAFARRLAEDSGSPWYGLVHMGGSKEGSKAMNVVRPVTFISLENGVRRLLSKSQYIHDLSSADAQYQLVVRYWTAVREVYAREWEHPRDFLLLKNMGVLSFSILGGTIIDRCMARGEVEQHDMARWLEQTRDVMDWNKHSTGERSVSGMSGNRAALIIAGELAGALVDQSDVAMARRVQDELLR